MIRAFIALDIPENVRNSLEELKKELQKHKKGVKWVPVKNIHITLKFLGNIKEDSVADIERIMNSLSLRAEPFTLRAEGVGSFPSLKKMRVIWAGLSGNLDKLVCFQQELERELEKVGFPRENRKFKPHLTLGRFKVPCSDSSFAKVLVESASFKSDDFEVNHVTLYKSILKPSGAVYEVIARTPFKGEL